jgi:tetratricopeptide (TPR) repeat protein
VGIAHSYGVLGFHAIEPPGETFPKAKAAAQRALEIDPTLAAARAPLAYALFYHDWNWPGAEREIRRCLAEAPADATAHNYYANFLSVVGRFDESMAIWRRAQELDPLAPIIRAATGWSLFVARRYEEAIRQAEKALEMDPTFPVALEVIGLAHHKLSRNDAAIPMLQKAIEASSSTRHRAGLAYLYAEAGRQNEARATLTELEELSQTRYVSPYYLAPAHASLGDIDGAFSFLEKAFAERSHAMAFLTIDPILDDLRPDPRHAALVRRVGLVSA